MIDCDVHNDFPSTDVLLPHLDSYFRDFLERGEKPAPGVFPTSNTRPWLHPESWERRDLAPTNGGSPGSDYDLMRATLLDKYDLDFAILNPEIIELSSLANFHYATALARAVNEWVIADWLPLDPRLRGSICVAPQDPIEAAAEIRRLGSHPGMVQVLISTGAQMPYGHPFYRPIFEAASDVNLPVAIHIGGTQGINNLPSGTGPATFYAEYFALVYESAMGHVASLIFHGVFEKLPNLRVLLIECGTTWLLPLAWRLDTKWKALRRETPWVKRLPSEYIWEHIRMATQPLDEPASKDELVAVLDAMHAKDILMFASDYPHWDWDDPTKIPIPGEWREQIFDGNAREVYGLPARSSVAVG